MKGSSAVEASEASALVPLQSIERLIYTVRGQRVMLDSDLARIYGIATSRLNEQVRRNADRFPEDFCFQLTHEEWSRLMSQIAISKTGRGGRRKLPLVFTEHGAIMAANVLNSPVAVQASVQVVRAFVRLRELVLSNLELARRLDELEKRYDGQFKVVFDALRQLMSPPPAPRIGFRVTKGGEKQEADG
ncbi:MAG: DNA-binding protein [Armatimonadetes bacterium CG_4_10_14_3_um_filter_66_18]|nr:ORF6N domain-containing protein [Armatimonadota bacterium]OIO92984.1 MAG: hypothetical protein AUJ96_31310 [Armatimonadetes bacterium CG2_30_66_41]PIU91387.1 MAG: DNA-binding protein [Armatimonadetes bacterium CG06_land_8_20_14_3_00_66_21]PIX38425.1 MAG: DNA-binding protein [Armatimonadetes bacterium CG_4_8_14_3_um_filter_66_20]PIY54172.1 MAG: DNA-binding protein [Armatimonadetes bacterium CG_4_10_14_3_um_filter_66_18]PIZ43945.1 MAG: DNA-binding protein [Armatimonadetes bacterium CG_4_10_14